MTYIDYTIPVLAIYICIFQSSAPVPFSICVLFKVPLRPLVNHHPSNCRSFHGSALGPSRLAWMHLILWPFTISSSFSPIFTSCLKRPCTVSYLGVRKVSTSCNMDLPSGNMASWEMPSISMGNHCHEYGSIPIKIPFLVE